MPYCVRMTVEIPHDIEPQRLEKLKAGERARAQELQRNGTWRHLWRVASRYENISVFDVRDHDALHATVSALPLFAFMRIEVTPLARHPSAIEPAEPRA